MAGHAVVRVTGFVRIAGSGAPYIDPVRVEVLAETATAAPSGG